MGSEVLAEAVRREEEALGGDGRILVRPSGTEIEGPGQLAHQAVIPLDQYLFRVPVSPARQIGKRFIRQGSICGHLGFVDRHDYYDKHTPLNQSVPLEMPFFDGQSSCFGAMAGENPEDLIIGRERVQDALSDVRKQLSDFEAKILGYYLDGLTIREMAKAVLRSPKSVDNAVQRIRRKAARHLQAGDLSKG